MYGSYVNVYFVASFNIINGTNYKSTSKLNKKDEFRLNIIN